jgi:hypothetical protein
MKDET